MSLLLVLNDRLIFINMKITLSWEQSWGYSVLGLTFNNRLICTNILALLYEEGGVLKYPSERAESSVTWTAKQYVLYCGKYAIIL